MCGTTCLLKNVPQCLLKKRFFICGTMVYIEIGSLMYIQTYMYSLKLKKLEDDRVQH